MYEQTKCHLFAQILADLLRSDQSFALIKGTLFAHVYMLGLIHIAYSVVVL